MKHCHLEHMKPYVTPVGHCHINPIKLPLVVPGSIMPFQMDGNSVYFVITPVQVDGDKATLLSLLPLIALLSVCYHFHVAITAFTNGSDVHAINTINAINAATDSSEFNSKPVRRMT